MLRGCVEHRPEVGLGRRSASRGSRRGAGGAPPSRSTPPRVLVAMSSMSLSASAASGGYSCARQVVGLGRPAHGAERAAATRRSTTGAVCEVSRTSSTAGRQSVQRAEPARHQEHGPGGLGVEGARSRRTRSARPGAHGGALVDQAGDERRGDAQVRGGAVVHHHHRPVVRTGARRCRRADGRWRTPGRRAVRRRARWWPGRRPGSPRWCRGERRRPDEPSARAPEPAHEGGAVTQPAAHHTRRRGPRLSGRG